MANSERFFGRGKISIAIAVVSVISSVTLAMIILGNPPTKQANSPVPIKSIVGGNQGTKVVQNKLFRKVISRLQQEVKDIRLTFAVPTQFQGQTLRKATLKDNEKVIALTFDDGPWPHSTEQILNILKKDNIKATFFMVGEPLQEFPQIAKKVVADGHAIANHTWNHWYRRMDEATAAREIDRTADLIYKTLGVKTSIFRPPGGVLNNGLVAYAQKKKYFVAMWSADSTDYRRPSVDRLANNVLRDATSGGMALMHDGGGDRSQTVKALPQIIESLKKQGFKFVTVPELLEIQNKDKIAISKEQLVSNK